MTEWTDETEWFYLGDDGVENVGPFNVTEMAGFHQDGGIDAETWIWNETMEGWKQLSDYQEFSEYLEGLSYMANMSVEDDAKPSSEEAVDAPAALPAMPQVPDEKRRSASREKARRTSVLRSNTTKNGLAPPPSSQKSDFTKLKELSGKTYYEQAQWLLNAYWNTKDTLFFAENPEEREKIWEYARTISKLDQKDGKDGNELDEFQAHVFLEKTIGALTVKAMRKVLKEVDVDFNNMVSLTEFFIYHYRLDYKELVNNVVDDTESQEKLEAAKQALAAAETSNEEAAASAEVAEKDAEDSAAAAEAANAAAEEAAKSAALAAESEAAAVKKEEKAQREKDAATAAREEANEAREAATKARESAEAAAAEAAAAPKATEPPQVGDIAILGPGAPPEYRGAAAVVTKVAESHCTAIVLDEGRRFGTGECWPSFSDVAVDSCLLRLGSRIVVEGMKGARTKHYNGLAGTVVKHPREDHPIFIRKPSAPGEPLLAVCVRFDQPAATGEKSAMLEPKFLVPYAEVVQRMAATLDDALASMAVAGVSALSESRPCPAEGQHSVAVSVT